MSIDAQKISTMREGGKALGKIRDALKDFTVIDMKFEEIEAEAQRLIKQAGMKPSFSTVPGYSWATCIMKNDELCHGIPRGKTVEEGDIITIDVGLINKGYHLDTTVSFIVQGSSPSEGTETFLKEGRTSLDKAIAEAKPGNSVYDVSFAMEKHLKRHGYGAVYDLTGHGIGKQLHMAPSIPVFAFKPDKKKLFKEGDTVAIEVMYTAGKPDLKVDADGWTYKTKDGSLSAMFEETVLITSGDPEILTSND